MGQSGAFRLLRVSAIQFRCLVLSRKERLRTYLERLRAYLEQRPLLLRLCVRDGRVYARCVLGVDRRAVIDEHDAALGHEARALRKCCY